MQRWRIDEKGMEEYLKSIQRHRSSCAKISGFSYQESQTILVLTEVAHQEKIESKSPTPKRTGRDDQRPYGGPQEKIFEYLNTPQVQVNIATSIATRRTVGKN